jgi:hypothetical protein
VLRVTFVMEQHLGHRTYYLNLRRRLVALPAQIQAAWAEVHYAPQGELWERVPGLPAYVRGTLRGRAEVRPTCSSSTRRCRRCSAGP